MAIKAYTDYPFEELGDKAGELAPVRQVKPLSYDGDKYVNIKVGNLYTTIKANYLYTKEGRYGTVPKFNPKFDFGMRW